MSEILLLTLLSNVIKELRLGRMVEDDLRRKLGISSLEKPPSHMNRGFVLRLYELAADSLPR
jgi:hypothetical protein